MLVREEILRLPGYAYTGYEAEVKLDQNEAAEDLPPTLKSALFDKLQTVPLHRYPDLDAKRLRRSIAAHFKWPENGVVVSGGSNTLIRCLTIAGAIGRSVVSVKPTFPIYSDQARVLGAQLFEVPLKPDFSLPLDELRVTLEQHAGVIFLANPAAPTGNKFSQGQLEELLQVTSKNWIFVIDEAYHQFAGTSALPLVAQYPHVVSLRTFSKAYGLGGLRIGFALAQPELATEIRKVVMPFSVSSLQVMAAETVLELDDFFKKRVATTISERERVSEALKGLNLRTYPSVTNFILFSVPNPAYVFETLLTKGVLIRRQDHIKGLEGALRVTIGSKDQNNRFLESLRIVLGEESYG